MKAWLALLAFVLVGCGKDAKSSVQAGSGQAGKPGATATNPGNYQQIVGLEHLEIEVPADAKPIGVVPGFENADKTFKFVMRMVGPEPDYADPAAIRASMRSVKDWLKEETFADGWYVTHSMEKTDYDDQGNSKVVGLEYSMMMRRKIDNLWYTCTCILPREELLDAVIKACKSVRKRG
jgi:hypothetical protein